MTALQRLRKCPTSCKSGSAEDKAGKGWSNRDQAGTALSPNDCDVRVNQSCKSRAFFPQGPCIRTRAETIQISACRRRLGLPGGAPSLKQIRTLALCPGILKARKDKGKWYDEMKPVEWLACELGATVCCSARPVPDQKQRSSHGSLQCCPPPVRIDARNLQRFEPEEPF